MEPCYNKKEKEDGGNQKVDFMEGLHFSGSSCGGDYGQLITWGLNHHHHTELTMIYWSKFMNLHITQHVILYHGRLGLVLGPTIS